MISSEKKIFSSTPLSKFSTDDGLIGWRKRERQTQRNKQELRETEAEIEGRLCCMCVSVCAPTPPRNDLWQGSKFDFPLRVNVTGLENSWHSFCHCTPSAYHHPTLPNGNDTCLLESYMSASEVCVCRCTRAVALLACICLTLSTVVILSVSVVGSKGLANRFWFARLPWPPPPKLR